jgi:hypothetical protein
MRETVPQRVEWSVKAEEATFIRAAMASFWRSRAVWYYYPWPPVVPAVLACVAVGVCHIDDARALLILLPALVTAGIFGRAYRIVFKSLRAAAIKKYQGESSKCSESHCWIADDGFGSAERGPHPWSEVGHFVETREFFFLKCSEPGRLWSIDKRDIVEKERDVRALLAAHAKRRWLL